MDILRSRWIALETSKAGIKGKCRASPRKLGRLGRNRNYLILIQYFWGFFPNLESFGKSSL